MRVKTFLAALLVAAFVAGSVWAQNPPAPGPMPGGARQEFARPLMEKLNLTDEQRKTMQEMRLKHQKELIPIQGKLKEKRLDLKAEMMADEPNQSKINSIVDEIGKLRTELQKKQIAHRLAIRNILTDEQRAIWDAHRRALGGRKMMKPCRPGRKGKRHFHHPPAPPMQGPAPN